MQANIGIGVSPAPRVEQIREMLGHALRWQTRLEYTDDDGVALYPGVGSRPHLPPQCGHRARPGHGRREIRTIQVMDAPADLGFPHVAQVFLLERYTTRKDPVGQFKFMRLG